jgi:hypothetical protein
MVYVWPSPLRTSPPFALCDIYNASHVITTTTTMTNEEEPVDASSVRPNTRFTKSEPCARNEFRRLHSSRKGEMSRLGQ